MTSPGSSTKESRHLWVGGLPDTIDETKIKEYFSRFGKVEGVKILPQKYPKIGLAAFVDFYDVRSAVDAKEAKHKLNGQELRTNFKAKQSEKFGDPGTRKWSDDEQEGKKGSEHRSSSSLSDSENGNKSSSDSGSDDKARKKKDATFLKIAGLPKRPERVLQDGLYYEYTRYSPSVKIRMYGSDSEKWAVAKFKKADKCQEARKQTQGSILFGTKIKVTQLDCDDFPSGGRDEPSVPVTGGRPVKFEDIDPQATRSLFVGNIPKNISVYDVRDAFQRYGNILDVEIKKMGGSATYGFVLYYDLSSAITAKKYMDGQNLKGNNIRVGFGKGTNSKQLWVDGVDSSLSRQQLERHMSKYGKVIRLGIDYQRNCAMVQYDSIDSAKKALEAVKGTHIGSSRKLMTDFANRDARAAFFSHMDRTDMEGSHQHFPGPGMYTPGMMDPSFRGGMMMPGGMPVMGMGRAGLVPGGPMDYMYDPFMEGGIGYYGGRPPFHPTRGHPVPIGMGHFPGAQYEDDYEEELAAYKRKRDWEKEREKRKSKKKVQESSSETSSESDDSIQKKKRKDKHKRTTKKQKHKTKKIDEDSRSESSSDEDRNEVRQKATQKSKEHREKARKKISPRKSVDSDSDSKKKEIVQASNGDSQGEYEESNSKPFSESEKKDKLATVKKAKPVTPSPRSPSTPPQRTPTPIPDIPISNEKPAQKQSKEPVSISDRRVSTASSIEEASHKSSVDEGPPTETPQSPPHTKVTSVQVESDWSSGDEFKSSDNNDKPPEVDGSMVPLREDIGKQHTVSLEVAKPSHDSQPPTDIDQNNRGRNRPTKHLPRKYQVEGEGDFSRKEIHRPRDPRSEKRYIIGPSSPSPPLPSYGAHSRRPYHSPPPEQFERSRHRKPRPYSPRRHRKHSRSPQRFHSPSPRPRSPPSRPKEAHGRYRSPPGSGRYLHSPPHKFQRSSSPLFPRSPGRKRHRYRTPSISPPRRSPSRGYKRDKSPGPDSGRSSPRYRPTKRGGHFSRTPSPKNKTEEKAEYKRRRVEESRPKSPSTNPPPSKGGGQLGNQSVYHTHVPHSGGVAESQMQQSPGQRVVEPAPPKTKPPPPEIQHTSTDNLLDLLRRYPVMWQGHLTLKNDSAAVQLHFLSGNVQLAKLSLPQPTEHSTPTLKIAQRMRLEKTQLEGVSRRMQNDGEHCLLLALPCGRDPSDVHKQTNALKNTFISYLIQKQAAGIINVPSPSPQSGFVLHIFPPCPFSQVHLSRVAPDLLSSASDNCHLMIVVATM